MDIMLLLSWYVLKTCYSYLSFIQFSIDTQIFMRIWNENHEFRSHWKVIRNYAFYNLALCWQDLCNNYKRCNYHCQIMFKSHSTFIITLILGWYVKKHDFDSVFHSIFCMFTYTFIGEFGIRIAIFKIVENFQLAIYFTFFTKLKLFLKYNILSLVYCQSYIHLYINSN